LVERSHRPRDARSRTGKVVSASNLGQRGQNIKVLKRRTDVRYLGSGGRRSTRTACTVRGRTTAQLIGAGIRTSEVKRRAHTKSDICRGSGGSILDRARLVLDTRTTRRRGCLTGGQVVRCPDAPNAIKAERRAGDCVKRVFCQGTAGDGGKCSEAGMSRDRMRS